MKQAARLHPESAHFVHRDTDVELFDEIYTWIVGEFGEGEYVLRADNEIVTAEIVKGFK